MDKASGKLTVYFEEPFWVQAMSKKNKKLMCAVYLSVDVPEKEIQDKEEKQFRYIKDYCKGNGLKIVKSYHRAGLSRCEMQKHFVELARQIEVDELQAVVIANSRYISCGVYDLYMKVGRIAAAGGKVYSVDEGLLELPIQ